MPAAHPPHFHHRTQNTLSRSTIRPCLAKCLHDTHIKLSFKCDSYCRCTDSGTPAEQWWDLFTCYEDKCGDLTGFHGIKDEDKWAEINYNRMRREIGRKVTGQCIATRRAGKDFHPPAPVHASGSAKGMPLVLAPHAHVAGNAHKKASILRERSWSGAGLAVFLSLVAAVLMVLLWRLVFRRRKEKRIEIRDNREFY